MQAFAKFIKITLFVSLVGISLMGFFLWRERDSLALVDLSQAPITSLTMDLQNNDTLYALVEGGGLKPGIYRSANTGRSWTQLSAGPQAALSALIVDPEDRATLYVGTQGGSDLDLSSIWQSTDRGQTWYEYGLHLPASVDRIIPAVNSMVIDPTQPDSLYVGTWGQGLYRFSREENSVELVGGVAFPARYIKSMILDPNGGLYLLTNDSGLIHLDGESWAVLNTVPAQAISLAIDPTNPETLYIGTIPSGAYRSTDGGQTWQNISNGLGLMPGLIVRVTAMAIDEADPAHLTATTAYDIGSQTAPGAIYESFDAGQSWQQVAEASDVVQTLTILDGAIYTATPNGLTQVTGLTDAVVKQATPAWSLEYVRERLADWLLEL